MARKVVNRKALREEVEAAEKAESKAPKKATKRKATKRKTRSKEPVEVRMKVFWGVYNQAMKRVAVFEYDKKGEADEKAESLSVSAKTPHFGRGVLVELALARVANTSLRFTDWRNSLTSTSFSLVTLYLVAEISYCVEIRENFKRIALPSSNVHSFQKFIDYRTRIATR